MSSCHKYKDVKLLNSNDMNCLNNNCSEKKHCPCPIQPCVPCEIENLKISCEEGIAIGESAGVIDQQPNSVAIGCFAGYDTQGTESVALGYRSGENKQSSQSVSIGIGAGQFNQGYQSIAIGYYPAQVNQGTFSIAIGSQAGANTQKSNAIAIGNASGFLYQDPDCISIGRNSGFNNQKSNAIAIGNSSGVFTQNSNCVAIGVGAGYDSQGTNSIAIGAFAGQDDQPQNSIILNATGSALNASNQNALYINPIRQSSNTNMLYYDSSSKEITYNGYFNPFNNTTAFALGVFSSTETQAVSAPNTMLLITHNNTDISNGVSVDAVPNHSRIRVATTGVYRIFSTLQMDADDNSTRIVYWLKKNGVNVPTTASFVIIKNKSEQIIAPIEWVLPLNANDYIEIAILSPTDTGKIVTLPGGNIATPNEYPVAPSIITTVQRIN